MSSPLDNLNQIKAEVEAAIPAVESLLAFIEKFSFFLPPAAKLGLTELQAVLNLVQALLAKV